MGAGGQIEGKGAVHHCSKYKQPNAGQKHGELVKRSDYSSLFGTCKTAYGVLCLSWGSSVQEGHRHARESTADVPEPGAHKVP